MAIFTWLAGLFCTKKEFSEAERIISWAVRDMQGASPEDVFSYRIEIPLLSVSLTDPDKLEELKACIQEIKSEADKHYWTAEFLPVAESQYCLYLKVRISDKTYVEKIKPTWEEIVNAEVERFMDHVSKGNICTPFLLNVFQSNSLAFQDFATPGIVGGLPEICSALHDKVETFAYRVDLELDCINWYPFMGFLVKCSIQKEPGAKTLGQICLDNLKSSSALIDAHAKELAERCMIQCTDQILNHKAIEVRLYCSESIGGKYEADVARRALPVLEQYAELNELTVQLHIPRIGLQQCFIFNPKVLGKG